jgi:hypothetical protein
MQDRTRAQIHRVRAPLRHRDRGAHGRRQMRIPMRSDTDPADALSVVRVSRRPSVMTAGSAVHAPSLRSVLSYTATVHAACDLLPT